VTLDDSEIASNDLLRAEIYPDAQDSTDRVTYTYNRQGQRTSMTDQNGSVHEYAYDLLGRSTGDIVATLGAEVDGAVRRIGTTYEVRGLVEKITSYSDAAGTTPANEVQNVYNSFAQLVTQFQEHGGAVNTGTSPKVEYAYADGSNNTIRPTSMTYPNGRVLQYLYDDAAADKLSRIRTLKWDGTDVCQCSYLGLGTFVITDYVEPEVKLDYALGSGANPYTGFDQFGRIIDLLWEKYGASSSSSSSSSGGPGNELVHLLYGYDQASNRTYREDLVAQAYDKDFDELYEYDGMQRLKKFHRGRLTEDKQTIIDPTLQQGWHLDATGNWQNFTQNDQADASQTLDQQRVANQVNEITQIARTVGADWATPAYDRNGNMTVIPQPKDMTLTFLGTWDAWNRLVKLEEPNGMGGWRNLAEYAYDGQNWRSSEKKFEAGLLIETSYFWYTRQWQIIEERVGTTPDTADVVRQHVWGACYVDELTCTHHEPNDRNYCLQDAQWNSVALADSSSDIIERYAYSAYGSPHVVAATFELILPENYELRNLHLFTGRRFDASSHFYCYRSRYLLPTLGNFASRDPLGEIDGANLFQYTLSNPVNRLDPSGNFIWMPTVTCDDENVCAKVTSFETVYKETDWHPCDKVNSMIMWGTITTASLPLKNPIATVIAGAITGAYCECQAKFRYKRYTWQQWFGEFTAGWSLISGVLYNYKFTSLGSSFTEVYELDYKVRWRVDVDGDWKVSSVWQSIPITSRTLSDITFSSEWHQFPTYLTGEWTGWIGP
jgi:RHS repeat-associated protein